MSTERWYMLDAGLGGYYAIVDPDGVTVCNPSPMGARNARLIANAPALLACLIAAVESSGFSLAGPTDTRAAEHGEPAWVCNARAAVAAASHE